MSQFVRILAFGYAVYTLLILDAAVHNFVAFFSAAQSDATLSGGAINWVPLIALAVIAVLCATLSALLAYFLAVQRRRRAALLIAGLTCVGFPVGTVLGGLTIYALARPEVRSQFVRTI